MPPVTEDLLEKEAHVTPPRKGRKGLVPAGQVLGVGLLCFGIWLLLDARQLYNSAVASSHVGVRRTVAIELLRPIARVNEFFGLDRLVDGGNRVIGRSSTTPGNVTVTTSVITPPVHHHKKVTTPTPPPSTAPPGPAPLAQPSAAHPLTVLVIGDSIGEDLGMGLGDEIGDNRAVHLIQDAVGSTGLADVAYYDWPAVFKEELQHYRPGLVIALFGGNDWQSFPTENGNAETGTAYWKAQYGARVAEMMQLATNAGAHMVWVGLPIMGPGSGLPPDMAPTLNSIYRAEADAHPGVSFFSTWKLFENAKGQYAEYLPDASGNLVEVRDTDGVHIAPTAGTDRIGAAVLSFVHEQLHVRL